MFLMKQKCPAKTAHIPCIVWDANSAILAEDDSLAETMQRAALHPLDQFRAFVALWEKGQGDEEIASAFFVSPQVVKQRLTLAVPWLLPCSSPTHMARLWWNTSRPSQSIRIMSARFSSGRRNSSRGTRSRISSDAC